MKGSRDGERIRLGIEGRSLYDQGGYGRPEGKGLLISPEEALYLVARKKIDIEGKDFSALLSEFSKDPGFLRRFLVYRDIRERGYSVQKGPHDFRVFRRGERAGTGQSAYLIRVVPEGEQIDLAVMIAEASTTAHMRKEHILAVVDEENELTYYGIRIHELAAIRDEIPISSITADAAGRAALVTDGGIIREISPNFGMKLDDARLLLSPIEVLYLLSTGMLSVGNRASAPWDLNEYRSLVLRDDSELDVKLSVYTDLRKKGYIPRTGYKFGHHFRVYSGTRPHSEMLVHALDEGAHLPMSTISRSVRLAHSVKKKMLFGCVHSSAIRYIEFARVKL